MIHYPTLALTRPPSILHNGFLTTQPDSITYSPPWFPLQKDPFVKFCFLSVAAMLKKWIEKKYYYKRKWVDEGMVSYSSPSPSCVSLTYEAQLNELQSLDRQKLKNKECYTRAVMASIKWMTFAIFQKMFFFFFFWARQYCSNKKKKCGEEIWLYWMCQIVSSLKVH